MVLLRCGSKPVVSVGVILSVAQLDNTGACVIQGDIIIGNLNEAGQLLVGGLIAQPHNVEAGGRRRLTPVVIGYDAFVWPDGVVSRCILLFIRCAVSFVPACVR